MNEAVRDNYLSSPVYYSLRHRRIVTSVKQRRDLCSGSATDSTNYRKCG